VTALAFRWFAFFVIDFRVDGRAAGVATNVSLLALLLLLLLSLGLLIIGQPRAGLITMRTVVYIVVFTFTPFRLGSLAVTTHKDRATRASVERK